jgi:hypothetical protein
VCISARVDFAGFLHFAQASPRAFDRFSIGYSHTRINTLRDDRREQVTKPYIQTGSGKPMNHPATRDARLDIVVRAGVAARAGPPRPA